MADAWIYPDQEAPEIALELGRALAELGFSPRQVAANGSLRPDGGDGASTRRPELAVILGDPLLCDRLADDEELGDVPRLIALDAARLDDAAAVVAGHELLIHPVEPAELRARITRARAQVNGVAPSEVVRFGTLEINLATYQVTIDGDPVDFTYVEYELLKFLVTHPRRVFSREALLNRVWGYDYYGGARTVDVHVRRVRAKLGQEHASHITTIRSVGYRFDP